MFPGYLLVVPWFVRNTYFLPIFQHFIAKLYESGIETKMDSYSLAVNRFLTLHKVLKILENKFPLSIHDPEETKAKLHFMFLHGTELTTMNTESLPLTVDMFQNFFVVCLSLLLIAIVSLVFEYFKYLIYSHER